MLTRLNAHREWANHRHVVWHLGLDRPEEYCLKMLSHVLRAEAVWLARLRDEPPRNDVWSILPPDGLEPLRLANEAEWKKVPASNPDRRLRYRRFSGEECESSVAEIVTHVCTHGMYHRGQVAAQAARVGLKVPSTDFIEFARLS